MVRKIFLLRHGEAIVPENDIADIDRPLTAKGGNQVRALGLDFKEDGAAVNIVYCSSAKRTRETFRCLAESSGLDWTVDFREDIYEAPVRILFDVLSGTENSAHSILLIGHNPSITFLAEYLSGESVGNMVPGQMIKLEFGLGSWDQLSKGVCGLVQ